MFYYVLRDICVDCFYALESVCHTLQRCMWKSWRDVSAEMCVLKLRRIWNALEAFCVSRKLKVLDKTKWIWQARLLRQRSGDPLQTRRKRNGIKVFFPLSPRRLLIRSLSPPVKLSMLGHFRQRDEITAPRSGKIESTFETKGKAHVCLKWRTRVYGLYERGLSFKECELIAEERWPKFYHPPP